MKPGLRDGICIKWLADGKRLSMRHGPIDLILEAEGDIKQVQLAYQQATRVFKTVLTELVSELESLRQPLGSPGIQLQGVVAKNMHRAATNAAGQLFATPMIAVAGAVADHMLCAMTRGTQLTRAYVNNGGDIALYLSPNAKFDVGICENIESGSLMSKTCVHATDKIGGIATSGWRGRSHSFGIADAVTVLAHNAATADAAATLIANSIDLPDHPQVSRVPATELSPDSDLGNQLVTVAVGELSQKEQKLALGHGKKMADKMINCDDVVAVYASVQGNNMSLGRHKNNTAPSQTNKTELLRKDTTCA